MHKYRPRPPASKRGFQFSKALVHLLSWLSSILISRQYYRSTLPFPLQSTHQSTHKRVSMESNTLGEVSQEQRTPRETRAELVQGLQNTAAVAIHQLQLQFTSCSARLKLRRPGPCRRGYSHSPSSPWLPVLLQGQMLKYEPLSLISKFQDLLNRMFTNPIQLSHYCDGLIITLGNPP